MIVHVEAETPFATAEAEQLNVEFARLGVCAAKVIELVSVLRAEGAETVRVLLPVDVALTVHVLTPLASVVTELLHVVVALVPEVTLAVVASPDIATLSASLTVNVQVPVATPLAAGEPEQAKVEYVRLGVGALNVTLAVLLESEAGAATVSVFTSATVDTI